LETTETRIKDLLAKLSQLKNEIQKIIVGQDIVLDEIIVALMAGGHCLLEGVPGLAKTLMVKTMSQALHLSFRRIQFTPDLMPTDIIGTEILEEDHATGKRFLNSIKGPYSQILFLQMRSTVHHLKHNLLCWKLCRNLK
jgi:MoxR-like ATPase